MVNYEEARVKLTNTQLNSWNLQQKLDLDNLRITKKNFQHEKLPHEVFLITT